MTIPQIALIVLFILFILGLLIHAFVSSGKDEDF